MHIYLREGVKTLINPNNKSRDIDDLKKEEILLSSNITEIEDFGTINKDIAEVMKLVIRESIWSYEENQQTTTVVSRVCNNYSLIM